MIGLPFKPTSIEAEQSILKGIDVRIHLLDTSALELRTVSVNSNGLVKVRFDQKIDRNKADSLFYTALLNDADDSMAGINITDYTGLTPYPASDFILLTDPMTKDRSYNITFDLLPLYPRVADSMRLLSYNFTKSDAIDQTAPELLESIPADKAVNVYPDSSFLFRFSEMVDSTMMISAVRLIDASEDTSSVPLTRIDNFSYEGRPAVRLAFGQTYQLLIDAPDISDRAGNRMSDSVKTISFSTIGLDTLGQISGEIKYSGTGTSAYPAVVSFTPAKEGQAKQITVPAGQRQFITDLLPGYYTVTAFWDRNRNGSYDNGTIIPYNLSEPFATSIDTFRVRTRFETAGVVVEF
jgi:hypothetical protein